MYSKDAAVLLSHSDPAVLAAAAVTEARVDGEALADLYLPTSTSKSNSVIFCPRNFAGGVSDAVQKELKMFLAVMNIW